MSRRDAPSCNSPDREVGVTVTTQAIEARRADMIMSVLRTSLIISPTVTTTLRSWLFHDGPSGLIHLFNNPVGSGRPFTRTGSTRKHSKWRSTSDHGRISTHGHEHIGQTIHDAQQCPTSLIEVTGGGLAFGRGGSGG